MDALVVLVTILGSLGIYYVSSKRSSAPLPPGPKKLPVLGNLFNMPRIQPYVAYKALSKQLGMVPTYTSSLLLVYLMGSLGSDVIHIGVPGKNIIVLDSLTAATDLLEKRSSIYSNRLAAMNMTTGHRPNILHLQTCLHNDARIVSFLGLLEYNMHSNPQSFDVE